jgi:hypothetical protein
MEKTTRSAQSVSQSLCAEQDYIDLGAEGLRGCQFPTMTGARATDAALPYRAAR